MMYGVRLYILGPRTYLNVVRSSMDQQYVVTSSIGHIGSRASILGLLNVTRSHC